MKALVLIIAAVFWSSVAPALSFWESLAEIESGRNDSAIGSVGEVSRYQIRPEIWKAYSAGHHYDYENHWIARSIAEKYLARLKHEFAEATGREATEADCVIMWKAGFTGYEKQGFNPARMSAAHHERLTRFRNLRNEPTMLVQTPKAPAPAVIPEIKKSPEANSPPPQPLFAARTEDKGDLPVILVKPTAPESPMNLFTSAQTLPDAVPVIR